jgi:hypothetical protein
MTSDAILNQEKTRAELLLQVREGDRVEMLFAANYDAQVFKRPFIEVLAEQVALYKSDYQAWTIDQMNRYEERREDDDIAAGRHPGFAQYHESELA